MRRKRYKKHYEYKSPQMDYGPIRFSRAYKVLMYGYDYVTLKVNGKPVNIPNFVFALQEKYIL
jgi:hypothetical protein